MGKKNACVIGAAAYATGYPSAAAGQSPFGGLGATMPLHPSRAGVSVSTASGTGVSPYGPPPPLSSLHQPSPAALGGHTTAHHYKSSAAASSGAHTPGSAGHHNQEQLHRRERDLQQQQQEERDRKLAEQQRARDTELRLSRDSHSASLKVKLKSLGRFLDIDYKHLLYIFSFVFEANTFAPFLI